MNVILVIREEAVCFLVLVFLACFHSFYQRHGSGGKEDDFFLRLSLIALIHVVFDIITVFTVNNRYIIPEALNKLLHLMLLCSGILFITEFLGYVIKLTMPYRILKIFSKLKYIPIIVMIALSFFLPIEYVSGNGTNYSYGPLIFVCYGIFAVFCIACMTLAAVKFRDLDMKTRIAVLPVSAMMVIMIAAQAVYPELLMTGAGVTFVCIGLFITLDNPVDEYMEQALWDQSTGVHNKNSFQKQLKAFKKKYAVKKLSIGFIVCDMNGLKLINDNYGHAEGDRLINAAASALLECLVSSYNIYRIGGDEFAVIYLSPNPETVRTEMENVRSFCGRYKDSPIPLSIAMGYASGVCCADGFDEIYKRADSLMYENKMEIKKLHPELCRK